jgi:hypothetical protein
MSQSKDEETKDEETKAAAAFIDGPLAEILGVKKRDVTCIGCGRMVSVDERRLEQLIRGRIMLAALVRPHGRVRIPARDLAAITQKCKLDVKVGENGDVVLSLIES